MGAVSFTIGSMLTALAFAFTLIAPATIELQPSDDIWVYSHASDPARDPLLKVWGAEGRDVARDLNEMQDYAYAYLKFDISKVPAGKLSQATLTVTHIASPGFDVAYSKQNPLTARPIAPDFSEKTWDYSRAEQIVPESGAKAIFGTGYAETIPAGDKEFTISIDLLKGPNDFRAHFNSARESSGKGLAFALTASLDVEEMGRNCLYKFYSKNCDVAEKRPVLKLTIE